MKQQRELPDILTLEKIIFVHHVLRLPADDLENKQTVQWLNDYSIALFGDDSAQSVLESLKKIAAETDPRLLRNVILEYCADTLKLPRELCLDTDLEAVSTRSLADLSVVVSQPKIAPAQFIWTRFLPLDRLRNLLNNSLQVIDAMRDAMRVALCEDGLLPAYEQEHNEQILRVLFCRERASNPAMDVSIFALACALKLPHVAGLVYQHLEKSLSSSISDLKFVDNGASYDALTVACVTQNLELQKLVLKDHQSLLVNFSRLSVLAICVENEWVEGVQCLIEAGAAVASCKTGESKESTLEGGINVFTVAVRNCSLESIRFLVDFLHEKRGVTKEKILTAICDFPKVVGIMVCTFIDDRVRARELIQLLAKECFPGDAATFISALDRLVAALHQTILSQVREFVKDIYTLEQYQAAGAENIVFELTHTDKEISKRYGFGFGQDQHVNEDAAGIDSLSASPQNRF